MTGECARTKLWTGWSWHLQEAWSILMISIDVDVGERLNYVRQLYVRQLYVRQLYVRQLTKHERSNRLGNSWVHLTNGCNREDSALYGTQTVLELGSFKNRENIGLQIVDITDIEFLVSHHGDYIRKDPPNLLKSNTEHGFLFMQNGPSIFRAWAYRETRRKSISNS